MSTTTDNQTQPAEGQEQPRVPSKENQHSISPGTPSATEITGDSSVQDSDSGSVYPGVNQMGTQKVREEPELESDDPQKSVADEHCGTA